MKKKLLSVIMCATMVSALVAGCGSSSSADTTTDTTTETKTTTDATATDTATTDTSASDDMSIYIVSKGFQHQYWQAVLKGAQEAADELGVTIDFKGPDTESDIAQQVQMLNNALNNSPDAIGLAALDTQACLEGITKAQQ
ncbi:LacI family transcriptional regulator, partial [Lachnotalea glycerini]